MTTGLFRVYWRGKLYDNKRLKKKWEFEAGFVYVDDSKQWIQLNLNLTNPDLEYKIMHNGKKIWSNC